MKISEIVLKGWRSFSQNEGLILKDLKRINILIGQNNSGKSNLGKYFFWIKSLLKDKETLIHTGKEKYKEINQIKSAIDAKETWAWEENEIELYIKVQIKDKQWPNEKPYFTGDQDNNVILKSIHNPKNKTSSFSVMNGENPLIAISDIEHPQVLDFPTGQYIDFNKNIPGLLDTMRYWCELSSCLVFIDPIRHHSRQANLGNNDLIYFFDGSNILNTLSRINANEKKTWLAFEKQMNYWLSDLLNESVDFRIEANNSLIFRLERNSEIISATLNEIGTGVSQIFMMLSFLLLNKDRDLIVFIDEPESNLHPEAVKKLINIFENTFVNHSFFISTHSSALIDQISNDWSIHRMVRKQNLPSLAFSCNTLVSKYEILDDLGIRASEILQSNLIIWVEGPSDRIYLRKWISDISKMESPEIHLEEGKHFSFLIYGGSNLNTHTILSENNEDIDILCSSRHSIVFCDSDYKNDLEESNFNLKDRVKKLLQRFAELKAIEVGESKNIEDYVKIWITEGRETENYTPKELFYEILSNSPYKKTRLRDGNRFEELTIDESLILNQRFSKFDAFDHFFSKMYKSSSGNPLTEQQEKKIALKYSNDKVGIAKAVVQKWKPEYYECNNLKENIKELVAFIKKANGLT